MRHREEKIRNYFKSFQSPPPAKKLRNIKEITHDPLVSNRETEKNKRRMLRKLYDIKERKYFSNRGKQN